MANKNKQTTSRPKVLTSKAGVTKKDRRYGEGGKIK